MKAKDAIRKPPVAIQAGATITEAAQLMDREVVGALVVIDGDRPVGIVTDRDIVVRGVARRLPPDARIDNIMSTELITLPADVDVRQAMTVFHSHAIRRLPLIENGRMVGMLTVDDLVINMVSDLDSLIRPVFGQVIFGVPEPEGLVSIP